MDADVDAIDIGDDDDDNAGIFSIANDCHSEDDDILTDEDNVLSAVHTKRAAVDKDESAEIFLLTREAVFRFVQYSIADATDGQKEKQTNLEELMFFHLMKEHLVVLPTANLPKQAVTNVGRSNFLPKQIGLFLVLRRMGNA
uniref:Uncharacterized protein n=1 Tax=Peronospora matthiolae TaxID=2874970 RepID=A0AAV1VMB3_9STRA